MNCVQTLRTICRTCCQSTRCCCDGMLVTSDCHTAVYTYRSLWPAYVAVGLLFTDNNPTLITGVLQMLHFLSDAAHDTSKSNVVKADEMALLPFPPHNFASSKLLLRTVNKWTEVPWTPLHEMFSFQIVFKTWNEERTHWLYQTSHTLTVPDVSQTDALSLTFKRRLKSRLSFAVIIRSSPYSPHFQDKG